MRHTFIGLAVCAAAALPTPIIAQLTTTYAGTQRDGDKDVPASAVFAIEKGRVAMLMKGSHSARMLFDQKAQVLRIVLDDEKQYFDLDKDWRTHSDPMAMMPDIQKQLEQMPAAQRAMAEQMMKSRMGGAQPQLEYLWTSDNKKIAGYDCTRVDGMRGDAKVTEYCASKSDDFKMSDAEHQTMLDMQGYLRNFLIMVKNTDDSMRAFQWDTKVDGYPVLTRCYNSGTMTLDLTLQSVSRKPLSDDAFVLPSGYKKMELPRGRG
jgi:Domain of unknown function (DUF4412)